MKNDDLRIERLLEAPYHIIDFLPRRVPENCGGRFFEVEKYYLEGDGAVGLRNKFADVLLRLNCYYGFEVYVNCGGGISGPVPERIEDLAVQKSIPLSILIPSEDVLITLDRDDTHMTVYNASEELLDLLGQLASADGLFLWR